MSVDGDVEVFEPVLDVDDMNSDSDEHEDFSHITEEHQSEGFTILQLMTWLLIISVIAGVFLFAVFTWMPVASDIGDGLSETEVDEPAYFNPYPFGSSNWYMYEAMQP